MKNKVNQKNLVDCIIDYESGELDYNATLSLFSYLISSGTVWSLQGHYCRTAKSLIDNNIIDTKGVINWDNVN